MSGSDSGKPIMSTNADSPSAEAFRASAKNVAAQCSIIASNLQEEMESESGESESSDDDSTNNVTS
jgi:ATP-binding protein involved in chromosome partitioning